LNESIEHSKTLQSISNSTYNSSCDDSLEKNGVGICETTCDDINAASRTVGSPSSRSNRRILLYNSERFLPTEGHGTKANSTTTTIVTRTTATLFSAGDEHVFR